MADTNAYSLGTTEAELARLDTQAGAIATPTMLFLARAGIGAGMRVLDLGTGLGHVAFQVRELVGPTGEVVGVDEAAPMLAVAEQRRVAANADNVRFIEADVRTFHDTQPFDAVVGRLILFHLEDPVHVLRHHLGGLADDGVMAMIDFDMGSARSEPPVPLGAAIDWVNAAFRHVGANPVIGVQLGSLLRDAGLTDVDTFGVQQYLSSDDPTGPALLASIVRSLAPVIVAARIATDEELALDTLQERLAHDMQVYRAVALMPTLAGAWGRKRPGPNGH